VTDRAGKFRQADRGTLFLDEIGELAPELQTKLLRVLETREVDPLGGTSPQPVDVRIVAATNADLEARVGAGLFRGDLYYRLNVIPIHVPPLRERPEDIPALWRHFVGLHGGGADIRSTPALLRALMARPWPGNVRELANLCQRMVLLRGGELLDLADFDAATGADAASAAAAGPPGEAREAGTLADRLVGPLPPEGLPLLELEREIIRRALAMHGGNRTRAAAYLGLPRHVLLYRLEKYGLQ
jgi:two-component system NtrC family response regulator